MKKIYYFLFAFLPMLALLLMGILLDTQKTESLKERRTLAKKPESIFWESQKLENYISDHLPLRDTMLALYFGSGLGFDFGTETVLIGKNDWLFLKKHNTTYNLPVIESYQNKVLFSDREQNQIISNLLKMKQMCDEQHIRLYLIFPPNKDRIYPQYMPSYVLREKRLSPVKQLVSLFPEEITVVPVEDMLIRGSYTSEAPLYYKRDTHWSEEGSFLAYQQLMKYIQKDFPNVTPKTKDDFDIKKMNKVYTPYYGLTKSLLFGGGCLFLPGMKNDDTLYNHYTYKNIQDIVNVKANKDAQFISAENPNGFPLKVYIIGDSFATYLHPYLSATFQYIHAHRFNSGSWGIHFYDRMKEMMEDKTDILILSISDLKLKDLLEPFK